jgi:xylulokinase/glycerol kinase
MSRSSLFNRILSDITGKIIEQPKNCEATAIGAWINAVVTLGMYPDHASAYGMVKDNEPPSLYTPNTDNQRVYSELIKKTDFLIKSTAPGKNVTFPR